MSKLDELGGLQAAKKWANEFPPSERFFPDELIEHIEDMDSREANSLFAGDPITLKSRLQRYRKLVEYVRDHGHDYVCVDKARELLKADKSESR